MKRSSLVQRGLSLLLSAILILSLASCGGGAKATSMHLKRTEGTVAVSDDGGKDIALLENLGLYSGYGVDTSSESYAWIDLDNVKLTKMDQDSEIAITKDGKHLEIEVKSGSLFFNVTEPLKDDETMSIRTSTMLVGIRGTCGWVEDKGGLSRVYLLEGTVEVTAGEQSVIVSAGEMAVLTADNELDVKKLSAGDIPAFVAEEVEEDEELCDKIYEASGLDVLRTAGGQEYQPDNGNDLLEALRNARDGDVITLPRDIEAELTETFTMYGGSRNNPVILDLNGYALTMASFQVYGALQIRDSNGTGNGILESDTISLANSACLFWEEGTTNTYVQGTANSTFTMNGGTINNTVFIEGNSTFTMNSGIINGVVWIIDSSTFLMHNGTIHAEEPYNNSVYVGDGSTFIMNGGTINNEDSNDSNAVLVSNSTFTMNNGIINSKGFYTTVYVNTGSTFTMNGGTINSEGAHTIHIYDGSTFILEGGTVNGNISTYGDVTFTQTGGEVTGSVY